MELFAEAEASAESMTDVLGRLFSLPTPQEDMAATLDYNARLVTSLREGGIWP